VPCEAGKVELFYRKDILEANGISTEQPTRWKDLLDRMAAVKEKTGQPSLLFPAGDAWGGGTFSEGFIHLMCGVPASPRSLGSTSRRPRPMCCRWSRS